MLKIIFFGDITGEPGRKAVKKTLPGLIEQEKPELILANVENLAHGKGVTVKTLEELIRIGVHGFTAGNHIYSKKDLSNETLEKYADRLVRPVNIPKTYAGKEAASFETNKGKVLIGNFLGQVFMEKQFHADNYAATLIDFHAEATSEKVAFGYHLDGRVSAVVGTHTHVPTADAKILSGGTAYITDVGMCGAAQSVLGVRKELSLQRFLTGERVPFDIPEDASAAELSYVMIKIDEVSGKAVEIKAEHRIVDL